MRRAFLVVALTLVPLLAAGALPQALTPAAAAPLASVPVTSVPLLVGGEARAYLLAVPGTSAPPSPRAGRALLIVLDGYALTPQHAALHYGLTALATATGTVVAEGVPGRGLPSWDAGSCCAPASARGRDDVGYVRAVVADAVAHEGVDPRRVVVAGFSNGAMLAYRVACDTGPLVAAIAVVSGSRLVGVCPRRSPVLVLVVHGLLDPTVPFAGRRVRSHDLVPVPTRSVRTSLAPLLRVDGCAGLPPELVLETPRRTVTAIRPRCARDAVSVVVDRALGHAWPRGQRAVGGLDASALVLAEVRATAHR